MLPVTSYFLACFTMTLLWFMVVLGGPTFLATAAEWLFEHKDMSSSQRKLCRIAFVVSLVTLIVAIPALRTLYAFWGQWS